MTSRTDAFAKAKTLVEGGKADEAFEAIAEFTDDGSVEFTTSEFETINAIISEKLTSCAFEEKKDACNKCIDVLEGINLVKEGFWLELYNESLYDVFSKMSRCAREEEREQVWNRLKEIYYEVILAAKKVWRDKNIPQRLQIYVSLAKLCKSYLDVADEESFKICNEFAKEAKFMGRGTLDDEDFKDASRAIEQIKKNISDAVHERELLDDQSE